MLLAVPGVTTILPVAVLGQELVMATVAVGVIAAGNSKGVALVMILPQASVVRT
jgi:hypothetical protein